jgi:hypothetical protein
LENFHEKKMQPAWDLNPRLLNECQQSTIMPPGLAHALTIPCRIPTFHHKHHFLSVSIPVQLFYFFPKSKNSNIQGKTKMQHFSLYGAPA